MRDREAFADALRAVPAVSGVYGKGGNYLLVGLRPEAPAPLAVVDQLLAKHGIYVKDVSGKFGADERFLRLAVRLPEENERLVAALKGL
jgi:histidinol-phosphate/aromatic aminotransferase/cobyric acid decarboxylase-like protein